MEKQIKNTVEIKPSERHKRISALSVMALLSLSLVGSIKLREQVCEPNIQTNDFFACVGVNLFMLSHVFIAEKPTKDIIECIFNRKEDSDRQME